MEIQTADVIFYKPNNFIGRVISKVIKSPYSHVALAIDKDRIIEADLFIKSRISTIDTLRDYNVYRLKGITREEQEKIVENAMYMLDYKYDYLQIVGLLLRLVFDINTSMFNRYNKFICSEIIDGAFLLSGTERNDYKNTFDITPQELFEKYNLERVS